MLIIRNTEVLTGKQIPATNYQIRYEAVFAGKMLSFKIESYTTCVGLRSPMHLN